MAKYSGSGWHFQHTRHSNARKYGKAGGTYASMSVPELRGKMDTNNHLAYMNQSINKEFALKKLHENQEIALEIQKRIDNKEQEEYFKNKLKSNELTFEQKEWAKSRKHYGEPEKGETAGQVLERLSTSSTSSEMDSKIMQAVLRQTGLYPNAVVVMGVVYLDGHGTMQNPPQSIHSVAKMILKAVEQAKKGKHYGDPMSFAGRTNKTLRIGTIPIGGRRGSLYINLELRPDGEFSVSGVEAPLPSGNALGSTGQIDMEYKHANKEEDDERYTEEGLTKPEQIRFAKGWNKDKWLKLLSIWKHKHLTKNLSSEELRFLNSLPDTDKTPAWV